MLLLFILVFVAGIVLCNFRKSFHNISWSFLRLPKEKQFGEDFWVFGKKDKTKTKKLFYYPKKWKKRENNVINKFPFYEFTFLFCVCVCLCVWFSWKLWVIVVELLLSFFCWLLYFWWLRRYWLCLDYKTMSKFFQCVISSFCSLFWAQVYLNRRRKSWT